MTKTGAFCGIYGDTLQNKVLEYLMENQGLDFAVCDVARQLKISKPTAYSIIEKFAKKGYVKKSRIVGKIQLYILETKNARVKLFLETFKECINLVMLEAGSRSKKDYSKQYVNGKQAFTS